MWDSDGKLDSEHILIDFKGGSRNTWRMKNAFEGVQIFGGIGSGKTSGSGKKIAKAFLKNGFGGLVHCAKREEVLTWKMYAKETGRENDLLIFEEGRELFFNPLQYEFEREGKGGGEIFNLSNLFMEIYKMGNRFSGGGGGEKDRYWDNALRRCMNRVFLLLKEAGKVQKEGRGLTISNMIDIMSTAPGEDFSSVANLPLDDDEWDAWYSSSFCVECVFDVVVNAMSQRADLEELEELTYRSLDQETRLGELQQTLPEIEQNSKVLRNYFFKEFASADEKTRSVVRESFLGLAEPFTMGILKKYFAGETTLKPEQSWIDGKIIILNFSVKEYLDSGMYAQGIFKLMWQQAIERRKTEVHPLPCFLWVDESQYFVNEYDTIFQTTARSSRAATVFITQNISNYYAQMGGAASKSKVDSLLANLSTLIFHANNDAVTNQWASDTIGKTMRRFETRSENKQKHAMMGGSEGNSESYQYLPQVYPRQFITLLTGGNGNDLKVQGIVQMKGHIWENGKSYIGLTFDQKH